MEKCKFEKGKKYCSIDFETIEILDVTDNQVTYNYEGIIESMNVSFANVLYETRLFGECN